MITSHARLGRRLAELEQHLADHDQQIQAGAQAALIFVLAIVFVYLFLAAQYESWSIPVAVMLSVPLALFGAILITFLRAYDTALVERYGHE